MANAVNEKPRPNFARSLKLNGSLTKDSAGRLSAEINSLRRQSHEPVAVHIRSGGGEVEAFYDLERQIRASVRGAEVAPVFTICHHASSAAAYLLVVGDCAFATKAARLHIHGVRCLDQKRLRMSTREKSLALAIWLDRANRKIAWMLAEKVRWRLAARCEAMELSSAAPRRGNPLNQIGRFVDGIAAQLSSEKLRKVLGEAFECLKLYSALWPHLRTVDRMKVPRRIALRESSLFHSIIAYELRNNPETEWTIRPEVALEMMMDFFLARDLMRGEPLGAQQFHAPKLWTESSPVWRWHLWCLSLVFCQRLLMGEYSINGREAWHLGLVDEVLDE